MSGNDPWDELDDGGWSADRSRRVDLGNGVLLTGLCPLGRGVPRRRLARAVADRAHVVGTTACCHLVYPEHGGSPVIFGVLEDPSGLRRREELPGLVWIGVGEAGMMLVELRGRLRVTVTGGDAAAGFCCWGAEEGGHVGCRVMEVA